MFRTARIALLTTVLLLAAQMAAASGFTYSCSLTAHTRFGFIPRTTLISIDPVKKIARVYDALVHEVHGKPIDAKYAETGTNKYKVNYVLENFPLSNLERSIVRVTVRLDVGRQRASMISYVGGYANTNRGSGKCKPFKGS